MRYAVKAVCALVSIIGVAAIIAMYLRQPDPNMIDNSKLPESMSQLQNALMLGQELEDQSKLVVQRCDAKDIVVADVIAGRLTLIEAAVRFRKINESNPQAEHWLTKYPYRNQPYELALCRSVIQRVELELEARGTGRELGIVARLEAELAEHLQRHGRVSLTD